MVTEIMNWTEKERERIKASFERAWYDYVERKLYLLRRKDTLSLYDGKEGSK